ncbi:MAG TPA: dual specificity protein phosphatase family protein [Candidatus Angelobacter sp.]|nr:dual specificity protein phosphatase family protein [Candidatus Angelobacter sp.]
MQFSGKSSSIRLYAAVLAVAFSFPLIGQTNPTSSIKHANVTLPSVHIKNFGQINENYYRGAQPEGQDYNDLASLGVKTVINLINDEKSEEAATVQRMGMKYVHIPMTTGTPPTPEQIKQFLSLVEDPASQPVFVHCVGGKHRTGVMTAIYRMTEDGWNSDQAFKEMKQYKFGADFMHPEFKSFVYHFQPDHTRTATNTVPTNTNVNANSASRPVGSDGP